MNSIIAILALSDLRRGHLIILVYPPCLSLNLGAIWIKSLFSASSPTKPATMRLEAISPFFDLVKSFSVIGRISLALASVVMILSFEISALISDLKKALLTFLTLPNFLPFFLLRIIHGYELRILYECTNFL